MVGWQGHDPELLADSVRNNVALGEEQIDVGRELSRVCLDREVSEMENGIDTLVGSRGVRLSGGQQARTALARTLSHAKPLIVLDDPFAALESEYGGGDFPGIKSDVKGSDYPADFAPPVFV